MSFLVVTLPPDYQYKTKIAIVIDLCLLVLLGLFFINYSLANSFLGPRRIQIQKMCSIFDGNQKY